MYDSKLFEVEVNHTEVFLCVVVDILVFWPFRLIKRGVLGVLKYHEVSKELQKAAENVTPLLRVENKVDSKKFLCGEWI